MLLSRELGDPPGSSKPDGQRASTACRTVGPSRYEGGSMAEVRVFKRPEMEFQHYGGPPGDAKLARLVGTEMSETMGAGLATFDGCSIEWTVLYDEVIVVLEGRF